MALARLSMKVGKAGKAGPHAAYIAREGQYANRLERGERLGSDRGGQHARHDAVLPACLGAVRRRLRAQDRHHLP
ncbi:hypothetical protein VEE57_45360 (plasmid) [Escherichia coli]|nr:hypothetical protein VEE57_45360 [Escherichia coli]